MKVSAVMPARGRTELAAKAVECFLNQTYPDKELLILDDAEDPAFPAIPRPEDLIECTRCYGPRQTIAEKRNWLCAQVPDGNLIMHWDSDDYSSPDRMAHQVEMFRSSGKAVVGYHNLLFFNDETRQGYKYWSHTNFYAVGTSLAFSPAWWKKNPFPLTRRYGGSDVPLLVGEDNAFVSVARKHRELSTVDGEGRLVARIHSENTSSKNLDGCSFRAVKIDRFPAEFFR